MINHLSITPINPRHIPNIITVGRILLVYPVGLSIMNERLDWALILFVIAGVSDGVDGFLAKHFSWQSRLGSYLDPIADKLLLMTSYVCLSWVEFLPPWLTIAVVARDIIILAGATAYYFLLKPFEGHPLYISKLNTLLQLLLVFAVLLQHGFMPLPSATLDILILLVFVTTLTSGALYVYIWGSNYYRETRRG